MNKSEEVLAVFAVTLVKATKVASDFLNPFVDVYELQLIEYTDIFLKSLSKVYWTRFRSS